jgi:deoxyribodipyrimidine photo-lyase
MGVDSRRVRVLRGAEAGAGPVVYWMNRDQRANDNWALLYAQEKALERGVSLAVVVCLTTDRMAAPLRPYTFMVEGLEELHASLLHKRIPFYLLEGDPRTLVPAFVERYGVGRLITDFHPIRSRRDWRRSVSDRIGVPMEEVDAHNIVPAWVASSKREFAAYTLRPKIHRALPEFLIDYPELRPHPHPWVETPSEPDWSGALRRLRLDRNTCATAEWKPGEVAARRHLRCFVTGKLRDYPERRNDPVQDGQSDLSPYLHFGQVSAQRVALEVSASSACRKARSAFLEELIVRRELADNYCLYTADYDRTSAFAPWAQRTLAEHLADIRHYRYTMADWDGAATHDNLWNAAQRQVVLRGKMHGYLRMYWAKKILEWTSGPEEAMEVAITLNDRYELDGRDPNGYAGIAWSIGGVHDRAWGSRPVFGKVRYMSEAGSRRKFDVRAFIDRWR